MMLIKQFRRLIPLLPIILVSAAVFGNESKFYYDSIYGGLDKFATPSGKTIAINLDADGLLPAKLHYSEGVYQFQYDSLARRVVERQQGNTLHLVYHDSLLPMAEFYPDDVYYRFPGSSYFNLAEADQLISVQDWLGSVRGIIRQGIIRARLDYDTTGKPTETDNCAQGCAARAYPYRYQGHRYLAFDVSESGYQPGIHDFSARLYDHASAKFTHIDLAGQSYSPYVAMGDDWISNIDRNGDMFGGFEDEEEEEEEEDIWDWGEGYGNTYASTNGLTNFFSDSSQASSSMTAISKSNVIQNKIVGKNTSGNKRLELEEEKEPDVSSTQIKTTQLKEQQVESGLSKSSELSNDRFAFNTAYRRQIENMNNIEIDHAFDKWKINAAKGKVLQDYSENKLYYGKVASIDGTPPRLIYVPASIRYEYVSDIDKTSYIYGTLEPSGELYFSIVMTKNAVQRSNMGAVLGLDYDSGAGLFARMYTALGGEKFVKFARLPWNRSSDNYKSYINARTGANDINAARNTFTSKMMKRFYDFDVKKVTEFSESKSPVVGVVVEYGQ